MDVTDRTGDPDDAPRSPHRRPAPRRPGGRDYAAEGQWPAGNLHARLAAAALATPDRRAVVDREGPTTYRDLLAEVRAFAGGLRSLGVVPGDVVAFQLPNWREAVVVHQAVAALGAISAPIVPIHRERHVAEVLRAARPRVLVVPARFRNADHLALARAVRPLVAHVVVVDKLGDAPALGPGEHDYGALVGGPTSTAVHDPDVADPAALLFTSGTTSHPKGVLHSHATLMAETDSVAALFGLGAADVVFMASPVTHVTGLLYGLQLPFELGGTVVLQDVWAADRGVAAMAEHGATFVVAATPFLRDVLDELEERPRPFGLRAFACGGADVPPDLVVRGSRVLGGTVTRVYGSTEHPTITGCGPDDDPTAAATTDGRAMPGTELRVLGEDGRDVPDGTPGEVVVRGPEQFLGYLDPADDEGAFVDGWFRTGDLAVQDVEGHLRIVGRRKDVIIRGGENLSASEIEHMLLKHPAVAQVAVAAMPDERLGERACAWVVARQGATPELLDLTSFLLGIGATPQQLPERLEVVDELPTTPSGKVQKFVLRERARAF